MNFVIRWERQGKGTALEGTRRLLQKTGEGLGAFYVDVNEEDSTLLIEMTAKDEDLQILLDRIKDEIVSMPIQEQYWYLGILQAVRNEIDASLPQNRQKP